MEKKVKPSMETLEAWQIDSANWKWYGYFYKTDKRLIVSKKNKWMG